MKTLETIVTCENCMWEDENCKEDSVCSHFTPLEGDEEFAKKILSHLKSKNIPSTDRKLKRTYRASRGLYEDKVYTLDQYYVTFINDILSNIRHGKTDYVTKMYHLEELLKFEPNMEASYQDGFWSVWLPLQR